MYSSKRFCKDFQIWIDEIMPKIIKNLEADVGKAQYELELTNVFIMSNMYHIRLQFENKNGQNEELYMIIKRPIPDLKRIFYIDLQFCNEILFYQMYTRPNEIYARCFYVEKRPPLNFIIALENVNKRGYYSCPYVHDPPLEYTLAAIRDLGRFHGKGYVMKEMQREKFFDIVTRIQEVRFKKSDIKEADDIYEDSCNIKTLRVVEYLRSQGHDAIFCDKMEALFSNAFDEVMIKTMQPLEPLATLCHGDFTLNNILFNTEHDGQYRTMLIDFAFITYSTPVVDLSTYIYLCCTSETRKDKFSEIMRTYHDALKEYLLDAGIKDIEKYSYNALLDDFARGALFGYVITCAFMPALLGYLSPETLVQEIFDLGALESVKKQKYAGGDELSKLLADTLLEMRDLGYLKHVL